MRRSRGAHRLASLTYRCCCRRTEWARWKAWAAARARSYSTIKAMTSSKSRVLIHLHGAGCPVHTGTSPQEANRAAKSRLAKSRLVPVWGRLLAYSSRASCSRFSKYGSAKLSEVSSVRSTLA